MKRCALLGVLLLSSGAACRPEPDTSGQTGEDASVATDAGSGEDGGISSSSSSSGAVSSSSFTGSTSFIPSSSAASSSSGVSSSSAAAPVPVMSCTDYCDAVMSRCVGVFTQYTGNEQCLAACASMPEGASSDTAGNTRGCRAHFAGHALSDPAANCTSAGPAGGGCGTWCEYYCDVVIDHCTQTFPSRGECIEQCSDLFADGWPTDLDGDSVQCRAWHATQAAVTDEGHCAEVGPASAQCSDPPPAYFAGCGAEDYACRRRGVVTIEIDGGGVYQPGCLKVPAGTTVIIEASPEHPLAPMPNIDGVPNPYLPSTSPVSQVLTQAGLYGYYCAEHGSPMGTGQAGMIWVVLEAEAL